MQLSFSVLVLRGKPNRVFQYGDLHRLNKSAPPIEHAIKNWNLMEVNITIRDLKLPIERSKVQIIVVLCQKYH